jgi:hypothetical protein
MCFDAHNWLLDYMVYKPQAVHLPSSLWLLSPTSSMHWRKSGPKSGPKLGSEEFAIFWPAGKPGRGRQLSTVGRKGSSRPAFWASPNTTNSLNIFKPHRKDKAKQKKTKRTGSSPTSEDAGRKQSNENSSSRPRVPSYLSSPPRHPLHLPHPPNPIQTPDL